MSQVLVQISGLEATVAGRTCFENFSAIIESDDRIAIIGRNGSGKSMILKILYGIQDHTSGSITIKNGLTLGYIPQIIHNFENISGHNDSIRCCLEYCLNTLTCYYWMKQ